jgi:cardiolipin synthase A/B
MSERSERTSSALVPGSSDAHTFAHRVWRIAAAHVSGGNASTLLRDGPATFDAMLALIAGARESVMVESYIVRSDSVGRRFAPVLAEAAGRGARVRVLYDWFGSRGTSAAFVRTLRDAGVDVQIFNRPSLRSRWLGILPRDHRKLLVVDPGTDHAGGITGGVGLGHEWSEGTGGGPGQGRPWRDTAVQISGPAAGAMAGAFERMWALTPQYVRQHPDASRPTTTPKDVFTAADGEGGACIVGIIEGEPGRYRVSRAIESVAVTAQRTIWIADAYFTPSGALVEALIGAARDGVDVRVLVPGHGNHGWVLPITRRFYPRLLRNGVRIWEWQGEMMHAKTQVADGRYCRVGSTDFNPLGVAINFELDAVIDDTGIGAQMEAMFTDDLTRSREVRL